MRRVPPSSSLMSLLSLPVSGSEGADISNTTYTLDDADDKQTLYLDSTSLQVVVLPKHMPAGFNCKLVQDNTGPLTVVAESGALLHSAGGALALNRQYSECEVRVHKNTDGQSADWRAFGPDLVPMLFAASLSAGSPVLGTSTLTPH